MADGPGSRADGGIAPAAGTRLPWLEAGEDDDRPRGGGALPWLLVAGAIVLALAGGGAWYVIHASHAAMPAADGGVIAAPPGPYKERPANPGGSQADGTGDTSYAVAEGKPVGPVRLGDGREAIVAGSSGGAASSDAAAPVGVPVQVGAFSSAAEAEAQWARLVQRYPELAPLHHRVIESHADLGQVFGLQAIAADPLGAEALCTTLRAGGLACRVKR